MILAMSSFEDEKFKKLHLEWKIKLEASGFNDIEDEHGSIADNKTYVQLGKRIGFQTTSIFLNIRDYYLWATQMANAGIFKSRTDQMIWILHSEGNTSREISTHVCLDQRWVSRKIQMIREELQIQYSDSEGTPSPF